MKMTEGVVLVDGPETPGAEPEVVVPTENEDVPPATAEIPSAIEEEPPVALDLKDPPIKSSYPTHFITTVNNDNDNNDEDDEYELASSIEDIDERPGLPDRRLSRKKSSSRSSFRKGGKKKPGSKLRRKGSSGGGMNASMNNSGRGRKSGGDKAFAFTQSSDDDIPLEPEFQKDPTKKKSDIISLFSYETDPDDHMETGQLAEE